MIVVVHRKLSEEDDDNGYSYPFHIGDVLDVDGLLEDTKWGEVYNIKEAIYLTKETMAKAGYSEVKEMGVYKSMVRTSFKHYTDKL